MILNLTQHTATIEQKAAGIEDMDSEFKAQLVQLITFPAVYDRELLLTRAAQVHELVRDYLGTYPGLDIALIGVMIGGMPSFIAPLENLLISKGIKVGYALSEHKSIDKMVDGKVIKTSTFVHAGMYWAN